MMLVGMAANPSGARQAGRHKVSRKGWRVPGIHQPRLARGQRQAPAGVRIERQVASRAAGSAIPELDQTYRRLESVGFRVLEDQAGDGH